MANTSSELTFQDRDSQEADAVRGDVHLGTAEGRGDHWPSPECHFLRLHSLLKTHLFKIGDQLLEWMVHLEFPDGRASVSLLPLKKNA